MAHVLQIGVKAALCLNIGMAYQVAHLGLFAAEYAFFAHNNLRLDVLFVHAQSVHISCIDAKDKLETRVE